MNFSKQDHFFAHKAIMAISLPSLSWSFFSLCRGGWRGGGRGRGGRSLFQTSTERVAFIVFSYLYLFLSLEGELLDKTQTKVFLLIIHSYLYTTALLQIYISPNSRNLLQFLQVHYLYTVKEKEGKPDRKPNPLSCGFINPDIIQSLRTEVVCSLIRLQ
jgi:hypothetical protein